MSKYLEYTRYANTSATKASAPVLGRFVNRDKPALEALCEEIKLNGGTPMDTETLLYIISGTIDYLREQYAIRCVRYRLFGITFEVACYGPFETADAKFDPARNSLEVAVRLGDEIKNCLVNETPKLVTEETASTARIYRAMDIESGALGIVIGGRKFRVTGHNVYVSREGESLKLVDAKGRTFDIAYDKVESPQRVEGHLVEPPLESGTCKLILTTYGGDESEDAKLGIYERVVSFVKFEEPVVKVTKVYMAGHPEKEGVVDPDAANVFEGENLVFGEGDSLTYHEIDAPDTEIACDITASSPGKLEFNMNGGAPSNAPIYFTLKTRGGIPGGPLQTVEVEAVSRDYEE